MPDGMFALAARLYLLAWDTDRMKVTGTTHLADLVRAGALTELAQRGLLSDEDGYARPLPDARTGDPVLDRLLELIEESRPRKWKNWVTYRSSYTLDAVRAQLAETGYLRASSGLFARTRYDLERPGAVVSLRAEARAVLTGSTPVAETAERDAAFVALAAAAELRTFATARERRAYKARIEALTARSGAAAPALKKVIQEVRAAVVAVVMASAAGASASGGT
ncbi:GOLPH3/VPS74 family protein [Streptomyces sp. NPDC055078]